MINKVLLSGLFLLVSIISVIGISGLALATPYQNTITVAKSGGDFTTVTDALNSITDASSTNPYLIRVMPGIYDESITMKDWVDVEGSGWDNTQITSSGRTVQTLGTTANTIISKLTILTTGFGISAQGGSMQGGCCLFYF